MHHGLRLLRHGGEARNGRGNPYLGGWSDGGGTYAWESEAGTTTSSGTGPAVDHTLGTSAGIYMYTEGTNQFNGDFILLTPCIDLGTLNCPKFKFFYHMYGGSITSLHVDITTNGGATWTNDVMSPLVGAQQGSNAAAWDSALVNLNSYIGDIVQFRFRRLGSSGFAADVSIDDVEVFNDAGSNVGITEYVSPMSGCGLSMDSVTVEVTNFGCGSVSNVPIGYSINAGTPVIGSVPGPIASGASVMYTFLRWRTSLR